MPTPTRSPASLFTMTAAAIAVLAVVGAFAGFYLGQRYRPRSQNVQVAQQPSVGVPPSNTAPAPRPSLPAPLPMTPAAKPAPPASSPAATGAGREHGTAKHPVGQQRGAAISHPAHRLRTPVGTSVAARALAARRRSATAKKPTAKLLPRPSASAKRLRPVAILPPARLLPVPRAARQRRVARALAARRRRLRRMAAVPHSRRRGRPHVIRVAVIPVSPGLRAAASPRSPWLGAPSPILVRAAQRVRYVEQAVVFDGRPATLATYIAWDRRQPRTFSFLRQDRRTDLARIVGVDEATRQVKVLVPSRGAVIQVEVPAAAVAAYGQALRTDPPSPELVARAEAMLGPGAAHGTLGPPLPAPPAERVAGMREAMLELVGLVRSVDPVSRRIVLAGPREKTPFRVMEGVVLPEVGQIVSVATTPDARISPRPAMSLTLLQPTVNGIVTRVRPTAVELTVRTVTPEGLVQEVPVPVSGDARVYISGEPGDLRALKQGEFIRAYMTPTGETRILGAPSERD
jgi:hypothetical protein